MQAVEGLWLEIETDATSGDMGTVWRERHARESGEQEHGGGSNTPRSRSRSSRGIFSTSTSIFPG